MDVSRPLNAAPARHGWPQTLAWIATVAVCCAVYFLAYFYPVNLHDSSHYAVSGVSMVRDHKNLIYPYQAHIPPGAGPAYEYFQQGTIQFGLRTDYPAKLYSLLFGGVWSVTSVFQFQYLQWISFGMLLAGYVLLYLIGREYLSGPPLAIFLLAVALIPVMRQLMIPASDSSGLVVLLLLTWLIVRFRLNPLLLGLIAGVACHLRGQSLSVIVVVPFIYAAVTDRSLLRGALLPFGTTCLVVYVTVAYIFSVMLGEPSGSNGAEFYITHFSKTFLWDQPQVVLTKFVSSVTAMFEGKQLYLLAPMALVLLPFARDKDIRNFTFAGLVYSILPLLLYSFDRLNNPVPRYYIPAIPLFMISLFLLLERMRQATLLRTSIRSYVAILLICGIGWAATHGFSTRFLDIGADLKRAAYLDFDGAQLAMEAAFNPESVVIVNHSLPTGLMPIYRVVYVPPFELFLQGNNKAVDGIAFVYGDGSPDDFFAPKDWLKDGKLPEEIVDAAGTRFAKVYDGLSSMVEPIYGGTSTSHFVIFKRTDVPADAS